MEYIFTKNQSYTRKIISPREEIFKETEEDFQEKYENNNFYKALDPDDFDLNRKAWWYLCRICGGQTKLRTKHFYCQHCGFSNHK